MFYCTRKKADSYLKKGIAEVVSEDPFVFKLLFEPKGKGNPGQLPRENKCVVCKAEENLTRHHVVPYALRKLMGAEFKDHKSEDVVALCEEHHHEYEMSSRELLLRLLEACKEDLSQRELIKRSKKASHNLHMYYDRLTEEKKAEYLKILQYSNLEIKGDFQLLMEKYGEERLYSEWRKDFLEWMQKRGIEFELKK
jgi:hypothetical protein